MLSKIVIREIKFFNIKIFMLEFKDMNIFYQYVYDISYVEIFYRF
jgi:hypothetical protein